MKYILTLLLLLFSVLSYAQELKCTVTVNYESLPVVNRELLVGFQGAIEEYMNKTKFTDSEWDGDKIECQLSIFFTGAADEVTYGAQVVVNSQRPIYQSGDKSPMLAILDNNWSFKYQKDQALYSKQSVFDPITSFLDYYAYVIIGFDLDSWEKDGGTPYFRKAFDIVNLGATSGFSSGWRKDNSTYNRWNLVEDLLNEKYRPFREAAYEYYYGLDMFQVNKEAGLKRMVNFVNAIYKIRDKIDIRSVYIKVFFDAKYGEIIDRLSNYPDKSVFKTLSEVDPQHAAKYYEAQIQ